MHDSCLRPTGICQNALRICGNQKNATAALFEWLYELRCLFAKIFGLSGTDYPPGALNVVTRRMLESELITYSMERILYE